MITVRDLAKKLSSYPDQSTEVYIAYDGDIAFPFGRGDDNSAFGPGGLNGEGKVYKFLVLHPDVRGDKLVLKGSM